jgi:hypothetical protein
MWNTSLAGVLPSSWVRGTAACASRMASSDPRQLAGTITQASTFMATSSRRR